MRVLIVFADADKRICVGRSSATVFLLLEAAQRLTARNGDVLVAGFDNSSLVEVFNDTRGSLLQMRVVGKFARLDDALRAARDYETGRGKSRIVR